MAPTKVIIDTDPVSLSSPLLPVGPLYRRAPPSSRNPGQETPARKLTQLPGHRRRQRAAPGSLGQPRRHRGAADIRHLRQCRCPKVSGSLRQPAAPRPPAPSFADRLKQLSPQRHLHVPRDREGAGVAAGPRPSSGLPGPGPAQARRGGGAERAAGRAAEDGGLLSYAPFRILSPSVLLIGPRQMASMD